MMSGLNARIHSTMLTRNLYLSFLLTLMSVICLIVSICATISQESVFHKSRLILGAVLGLFFGAASLVVFFHNLNKKSFRTSILSVRIFYAVFALFSFFFAFSFPPVLGIGVFLLFLILYSILCLMDMKFFFFVYLEFFVFLILYGLIQDISTELFVFSLAFALFGLFLRCTLYRSFCQRFELQEQYKKISDESNKDTLTGCYNRKGLDAYLPSFWKKYGQGSGEVALAIVDIDNFKLYNDAFGHPAGDECLKRISTVIRDNVGTSGRVFRIGGEELLILFFRDKSTQRIDLITRALSVVRSVSSLCVPHAASAMREFVTISIGLHAFFPSEASFEQCYDAADMALYVAKNNGKNAVVCNGKLYRQKSSEVDIDTPHS